MIGPGGGRDSESYTSGHAGIIPRLCHAIFKLWHVRGSDAEDGGGRPLRPFARTASIEVRGR